MKSLDYFLKPLLTVLLLITIAIGLLNTEYFYSSTSIAYYGFGLAALFFIIVSCFYSINSKGARFKVPNFLFGIWCCYVLIHYFTHTATVVFTIYSVVLYFLLLKATALFSSLNFNFNSFFIGIAGIASLESTYCIAQFLGWFKSQNELYIVTGSWNNPNVTALFLALTTPVFLFLFSLKQKQIVRIGFLSLLLSLLLLKCRSAFIGTFLSALIFYGLEYNLVDWIKNKKNRFSVKALVILSLLIIIPISSHLYHAKKASADGRKFIWKLSTLMATEKPLTGYGYGFFEKEYNLYQSDYIKNDKATPEELANAGPVIMPHNELLQNAVEGGGIGLLLIALFFGSLLFTLKQKKKISRTDLTIETVKKAKDSYFNLSYAGVVAFIGMSMVNSTMQIVPTMCLLVIYAALICSTTESIQLTPSLAFLKTNKWISSLTTITISSISIYLLYLLIGMATADHYNKKVAILKKEGHYEQALQILSGLQPALKESRDYWTNYGSIYIKTQQYAKALFCLEKAKTGSTLPELYSGSGLCYEKLHQYPKAIQEYETLIALYPSKFLYKMILLETYLKNKEASKAIALAQEIIKMKPKIPSEKVNQYKSMCRGLLKHFNPQKGNNFNNQ